MEDIRRVHQYHDEEDDQDPLNIIDSPDSPNSPKPNSPKPTATRNASSCQPVDSRATKASTSSKTGSSKCSDDSTDIEIERTFDVDGTRVPDCVRLRSYRRNVEGTPPVAFRYDLIIENKGYGWFATNFKSKNIESSHFQVLALSHVYRQLREQATRIFEEDHDLPVVSAIAAVGRYWQYFEIPRVEASKKDKEVAPKFKNFEGVPILGSRNSLRQVNTFSLAYGEEEKAMVKQVIERLDQLDAFVSKKYLPPIR